MHPKGKVVHDHHHLSDKEMATLVHILAGVSALALTMMFVLL